MAEWKFRYETQEQLKQLFTRLGEHSLEISVSLQPAASPQFFQAWQSIADLYQYNPFRGESQPKPDQQQVKAAIEQYCAAAQQEKIHPFTLCEFREGWCDPSFGLFYPVPGDSPVHYSDEPRLRLTHFLAGWRYRYLHFDSIDKLQQRLDLQQFVIDNVPQQYHIDHLFIKLNPKYSISDHYYTREENDGILSAGDGKLRIRLKNDPVQRRENSPTVLGSDYILQALKMSDLNLKLLESGT